MIGLDSAHASAFTEMMTRQFPKAKAIKCQVTGPVTFGMQVVDADKRPIYYDSQLGRCPFENDRAQGTLVRE